MSDENKIQMLTPLFRLSFPKLLKAEPFLDPKTKKPKGDPKFTMSGIFEPDALKKFVMSDGADGKMEVDIVEVCKKLASDTWNEGKPLTPDRLKELFPKQANGKSYWPIQKGDNLVALEASKKKPKEMGHLVGMFNISMQGGAEYPPRLSFREAGNPKPVYLDRDVPADVKKINSLFTAGNWCKAEVNLRAIEVNSNKYITFYLNHVQFKKVGEKIGGGNSLMDRFDGADGGEGDADLGEEGFSDDI